MSSTACSKCGGRKYLLERRGDRAGAQVCTCARPCSDCGDLGYVYVQREEAFSQKVGPKTYDAVTDCVCRTRDKRIRFYNEARFPAACVHESFEAYKPSNQAQARALKQAQAFAHGYTTAAPARGFILSGPVGTGKTHLIYSSLLHLVLQKGVRCAYVEISLLYAQIRRGFQEGKSGGEIIGPLSEVEVLAIDELGKGRGSAFEMETMDELIARRYNAKRTTLFATNFSLAPEQKVQSTRTAPQGYTSSADNKKSAKDSDLLRERVGERIYSRLCEMCDFLEMPSETPDHRRARHELR